MMNNEYDSNFDADKRVKKAKHTAQVLNAHAELLNFFANISDEDSDGSNQNSKKQHDFLKKQKRERDLKKLNDINTSKRKANYKQ
jgi:hypothetical protein